MLDLRFCARAFSSCGKQGPLFIVAHGPLTIAASLVAEHRLQTRRLSSCGSRAQLLRGMWDLPRPGLKPVSPALVGGFSTTAPPGKPLKFLYDIILDPIHQCGAALSYDFSQMTFFLVNVLDIYSRQKHLWVTTAFSSGINFPLGSWNLGISLSFLLVSLATYVNTLKKNNLYSKTMHLQ